MLNCNNWEGRWRERGAGNGAWGASVMGCRIESPCASWLVLPGGEEGLGDVHLQKPSLPTGLLQAKRRGKGLGVGWSSHCDVKITGGLLRAAAMTGVYTRCGARVLGFPCSPLHKRSTGHLSNGANLVLLAFQPVGTMVSC